MTRVLITAAVAAVLSGVIGYFLIPVLRALKAGQSIRESGFGRENIPAMMAAVVVISVPLIVLFLVFRKKIMAFE